MSVPSSDVSVLIHRVWRWAPFVVLMVVLGAAAGWASTLHAKPTYTTRAALTVVSENRSPDQDAILSQGYADFFNDGVYQSRLRKTAGVADNVTFEAHTALASPILYVTATSDSQAAVTSAARAMASALQAQVNGAINQSHQEQINAALDAFERLHQREPHVPDQALLDLNSEISAIASDSTNKLQTVQLDSSISTSTMNKHKRLELGVAAGIFLGVLGALVLGGLSRRMQSSTDVERALGAPPLAVLPRRADSAEAALLWTTITRLEPPVGSVLAVAHAHGRERTHEVARQLVSVASRSGTAVLIDWSTTRPGEIPGLSDYVRDIRLGVSDVVREIRPNLYEVSYGTVEGDAYSVMSSSRAKELLGLLRGAFQAVVIDVPSLLDTSEGPIACTLADATLVAIDQRRSRSTEVAEAVGDLQALNIRIAGSALLLKRPRRRPSTGTLFAARKRDLAMNQDPIRGRV